LGVSRFPVRLAAARLELIEKHKQEMKRFPPDLARFPDSLRRKCPVGDVAERVRACNLNEVVQHGKRADAIVKNMLLYSRQGSEFERP
jgi:hypothetical protein